MTHHLHCIMLIDDDEDDIYLHERVIKKCSLNVEILIKKSGEEALDYLMSMKHAKAIHPDLIFLDINMPGMNGWAFLNEYNKLDQAVQSSVIIVMLSTSQDEMDRAKAKQWNFVYDYIAKPLSGETLMEIVNQYFS